MNYSADTCPCVLVFYIPYVLMTHLPELITNSTSKKGIVLSSFCISNVNLIELIEGCKLLMCSRNRWRFSRPCACPVT